MLAPPLRVACLACSALVAAPDCGSEPAAGSGGDLVSMEGRFSSIRATDFFTPDLESDVYATNADGSGEKQLTDSPGLGAFPTRQP